jgi:hypothetical protein
MLLKRIISRSLIGCRNRKFSRNSSFPASQKRICENFPEKRAMKYILVTGGVISGVGKGVIASSFGTLLNCCGISVTSLKIDPYINIDAGTFSPYEHGEFWPRWKEESLCRSQKCFLLSVFLSIFNAWDAMSFDGRVSLSRFSLSCCANSFSRLLNRFDFL